MPEDYGPHKWYNIGLYGVSYLSSHNGWDLAATSLAGVGVRIERTVFGDWFNKYISAMAERPRDACFRLFVIDNILLFC